MTNEQRANREKTGRTEAEAMQEQWLIFRHEGRELCSYTLRGTFPGERQATIELLAYENGIPEAEITCTVETRGRG